MRTMKIPHPWTDEEERAAHRVASAGRSYLYLASRLLSDPVQRTAFEVAYASMRGVDDTVDEHAPGPGEAGARAAVRRWLGRVRAARRGDAGRGHWLQSSLAALFRSFELPFEPWELLGAALLEDVRRDGFETLEDFLAYAEGVAVGPGRLFAMVVSARPRRGRYVPHPTSADPGFAALARFTYLVHGLRDLGRDLAGPARGTALAPRAELRAAGLDPADLAQGPADRRRAWALSVASRARALRAGAGDPWDGPDPLPPEPAFVLAFLIRLYERQLDRIEECGGDVFGDAHRMGPADVLAAAEELAGERPGAPPDWRARLELELGGVGAPRA